MLTEIPIFLLVLHFIGDFLLQSNWMATYKSKEALPLLVHVSIYSLCFLWLGYGFWLAVFLTHLITDYLTSRITSRLWFVDLDPIEVGERMTLGLTPEWEFFASFNHWKRHWFFVCIGADQLIHYLTLAMIWDLLG